MYTLLGELQSEKPPAPDSPEQPPTPEELTPEEPNQSPPSEPTPSQPDLQGNSGGGSKDGPPNPKLEKGAKGVADPTLGDPGDVGEGEDWNLVPSELKEDLRQKRGTTPPERYRKVIEKYFESVGEDS